MLISAPLSMRYCTISKHSPLLAATCRAVIWKTNYFYIIMFDKYLVGPKTQSFCSWLNYFRLDCNWTEYYAWVWSEVSELESKQSLNSQAGLGNRLVYKFFSPPPPPLKIVIYYALLCISSPTYLPLHRFCCRHQHPYQQGALLYALEIL